MHWSAEPSVYITRMCECWKAHVLLKLKLALYTAGSAIAQTGSRHMLALPHAVTADASLYIEQENLIVGKPQYALSN